MSSLSTTTSPKYHYPITLNNVHSKEIYSWLKQNKSEWWHPSFLLLVTLIMQVTRTHFVAGPEPLHQVFPLQFLCRPDLHTWTREKEKSSINSIILTSTGEGSQIFWKILQTDVIRKTLEIVANSTEETEYEKYSPSMTGAWNLFQNTPRGGKRKLWGDQRYWWKTKNCWSRMNIHRVQYANLYFGICLKIANDKR